jgi:hypothetical protein
MRLLCTLIILCLSGAGCSRSVESTPGSPTALPQLFARGEAGFADGELRVQDVGLTADEGITIVAAALDGREQVAVRFTLLPDWRGSTPKGFPQPLFAGRVLIESVGPRTEAFARAVAKSYRQNLASYESTYVSLTAISLQGDPMQVRTQPVKLKVFYESSKEAEYAEAYLNFDLPRGIVQFHEKDPDYREAIVRFLSRKNG